ncbi:MAG: hypothetical protein CR991_00585 [Proteobacteria bacterium]|nr:MAG: hypothetical protein CR991_00585 [Pseudomonadota bacterium]
MSRLIRSLLLILLFIPLTVSAFTPVATIQVDEEWQGASPEDVKAVLDSTLLAVSPYIGSRKLGAVIVKNDEEGPISLYTKGDQGEYIVKLNVTGRYWAQMTYQFSHELCHLLSNYDLAPANITHQQWFEESLCEAFSLFALERMAELWETHAPYASWQKYAPEFQKYADNMKQEKHRSFAPRLSEWYHQQRSLLESNPYAKDRQLNEKMASHLLAIFEKEPRYWASINYINLGENSEAMNLEKYMADWYQYTPPDMKKPVAQIEEMLGISNIATRQ